MIALPRKAGSINTSRTTLVITIEGIDDANYGITFQNRNACFRFAKSSFQNLITTLINIKFLIFYAKEKYI